MQEYTNEREVVAHTLRCHSDEVTVTLSPPARAVPPAELARAAVDNGLRRRLVAISAIHPDPQPEATYRSLSPSDIGISRHGDNEWLWASGPETAALIHDALKRRHATWRSPLSDLWPVDDATLIPLSIKSAALLEELSHLAPVVRVDTNGRPYPDTHPVSEQ